MNAVRNFLVLFSVLSLVLPAAAVTGAVTREVISGGDGIYQVTLQVSHLPMVGIMETLPDGASYEGSSLPLSQVKIQDHRVAFVLNNQSMVQYTVRSPQLQEVHIQGVWEDLLQGERGYVQDRSSSSPPQTSLTAEIIPTTQAPMGEMLPVGALVVGTFFLVWYREGHR